MAQKHGQQTDTDRSCYVRLHLAIVAMWLNIRSNHKYLLLLLLLSLAAQ